MIDVSAFGHDTKSIQGPDAVLSIYELQDQTKLDLTVIKSHPITQQVIAMFPSARSDPDFLTNLTARADVRGVSVVQSTEAVNYKGTSLLCHLLCVLYQGFPTVIFRNVYPSTITSCPVSHMIFQQYQSSFVSSNLVNFIPRGVTSGCMTILSSGKLYLQVNHTTRQRLGLDFSTLPRSHAAKASNHHVICLNLLDAEFTKKTAAGYSRKYRRLQWAFEAERCESMNFIGALGIPLIENDWLVYQEHLELLLRQNGSPNAIVEFQKSDVQTRKYDGGIHTKSQSAAVDVFAPERHTGAPAPNIEQLVSIFSDSDREESYRIAQELLDYFGKISLDVPIDAHEFEWTNMTPSSNELYVVDVIKISNPLNFINPELIKLLLTSFKTILEMSSTLRWCSVGLIGPSGSLISHRNLQFENTDVVLMMKPEKVTTTKMILFKVGEENYEH